ncbi:MAG: RluA family pseudouridine synthase [Candidatus Pacebacteria bacterium]|nr:RluA family pseudouridine synthase [Candidatus Paceibacterota bacterium]
MKIDVLFENQNLLIINKPVGIVVHGDGKTDEPTVVDWILEYHTEINGVGENMFIQYKGQEIEINRPGIVHRIDRETSGCLLIAKTQESFKYLKELFKTKNITKKYLALVYGHIKSDTGVINEPIGRSAKDFRMKMAGPHARGRLRDAETDYRVIERYFDSDSKKDIQGQHQKYTFVECSPKTGRTHQIRVHMKWLNHPLISDSLYKGKRKNSLGLSRTALHAASLSFTDQDNQLIEVSCDLPADITAAIDSLSVSETNL